MNNFEGGLMDGNEGIGSAFFMDATRPDDAGLLLNDDDVYDDNYVSVTSLIAGFVSLYALYYLLCVARVCAISVNSFHPNYTLERRTHSKPVLYCNAGLKGFLSSHCPLLYDSYLPPLWCVEARIQTIFRGLFQSCPHVPYTRELLPLSDGGDVALDWVLMDSAQATVIILPGLTGSSDESYVRHVVRESINLKYRSVVLNYRGVGGSVLKTSRTYCATKTDDLHSTIQHVTNKHPESPIFVIGVSMGGLILTNYLAEQGKNAGVQGALAVSAPWDVFASCDSLERGLNLYAFNQYLCGCLKDLLRPNQHLFTQHCDVQHVLQSRTIRDFDSRFTVKIFGYEDVNEYYRDASITTEKLHKIKVPLLFLNAADDPFSPGHSILVDEAPHTSHTMIAVTSRGGHIAFLDGLFLPQSISYIQRIFSQFSSAVIGQYDELVSALDSHQPIASEMSECAINNQPMRSECENGRVLVNQSGTGFDMAIGQPVRARNTMM